MRTKLFSVSIHDCRAEYIAATHGAGGQNKNRRHTAVRLTHEPSGAVGYSADQRDQLQNKVQAFKRLGQSKEFLAWARLKAAELSTGKTLEQRVEEDLNSVNLLIEVRGEDGKWHKIQNERDEKDA